MPTKHLESSAVDELRPEYDLGSLIGRVRGKYYARATAGTTLVLLEPDIADAFPDGPSVNKALAYLRLERSKPAKKRSQPAVATRSSKRRSSRRG